MAVPTSVPQPTVAAPTVCVSGHDSATVSLIINDVYVVQSQETSVSHDAGPTDSVEIDYGVGILQPGSGNKVDFGSGLSTYLWHVKASLLSGDKLNAFKTITRTVSCGNTVVAAVVISNAGGSSGTDTLGVTQVNIPLIADQIPMLTPQKEDRYTGTTATGTYDYRVVYTIVLS